MTDTTTGAADLLDPPSAAAAAGDAQLPAAPAAPADKPWFDGIQDADLKGWLQNKNFPSVDVAMSSYRGLETVMGRDKVPLPKDDADTEGWERLAKAAGRPETPEGYGLDKLEGADEGFAKNVATWLHEAGVGARGAKLMAERWNAFMAEQAKAAQTEFETQSRKDVSDLRAEWGAAAEENFEHFRRGARQFGVDKEAMKSIEVALGTKKAMDLFAKIGKGLGEDSYIEGDGVKQFGMTIEGATARRNALMGDKEWVGRYVNGGAAEKAEMEKLNAVIAGGRPQ